MAPQRTRIATTALAVALVSVVGIAIGVGLIHAGILQPLHGFLMFAAACLLGGASAILLGLIGVVRARFGKGTIRAYVAIAVGAILVGTAVVKAMPARELPRINDITTDLNDVPAFVIDTGESGRDMSFNVEFSGPIRTTYADLKTTVLIEPTGKVFDRVYVVARRLGWNIIHADKDGGVIQATDSSEVFKFVDDIIVRIRDVDGSTRVDMRSKSRDGKSDFGVNAHRIRAFSAALIVP